MKPCLLDTDILSLFFRNHPQVIYADLRKKGTPVDDIDLLIAGVAMANNLVLITHNQKHLSKIEGLQLEDWSLDNS